MSEPTIKVKRLAFVRVTAPEPAKAETFLAEFGLQLATRTDDAAYFRGTDPDPHCYVLSQGEAGVPSIAFEAESAADLEKVAALPGASPIEKLDEPGGGQVVRLRDPQGQPVEIVHGIAALEPIEPAPPVSYNMDGRRTREGELPAVRPGPSHVKRIGHLVLESADPVSVYRWYHEHLGLRKADELHLPDGRTQMLFASLDRGAEYVDHHVVGFQYALDEGARVQHVAFEVGNLDDLMAGHEHLKAKRRKSVWGVGRHRYGGQIFDYWANPWGVIHEHWTDTDLVNDQSVATDSDLMDMQDYWGPPPSVGFIVARWNWKAVKNLFTLAAGRLQAERRNRKAA
ncbi:MAG: VOC family protein [Myxococcota bacterium]|nr:VOC family protein [Myxococcota bacterium]